jgi:hypothetical protein
MVWLRPENKRSRTLGNDCKILASLQTVYLTLKLVRNGAPEKRRTISFVEQTTGGVRS